MPVLLFTSRYNKPQGPEGRFGYIPAVGVESYEKATGKLLFHRPEMESKTQPFYAVKYDHRSGKVEMVSTNYKVTIQSEASP